MEIKHIYFGGSFYPPHKAHTEMLKLALKEAPDADLHLVPTKQNPLKESRGAELSLIHAWLEDLGDDLSYRQFSRCRLETLELFAPQEKNYTVESIQELKTDDESWALLLGSDSAATFHKWKDVQKLIGFFQEIWIVPRGHNFNEAESMKVIRNISSKAIIKFLNPVTQISSSEIRNGTAGQPLEDFLSPRVLEIWKHLEH